MAQGGLAGNAGFVTDGIVCCASLWVEFAVQALQSPGWSAPTIHSLCCSLMCIKQALPVGPSTGHCEGL